ncbi:MAG: ferrochelatase, partial [Acidobacteriia bacterium]|nr:ferrochelatase [Terriglobia bacterium]
YPQYSRTTTGSSLAEWKRQLQLARWDPPAQVVHDYHDDPAYIASVAGAVAEQLARFPRPDAVHLVFCAHSVPVSVIKAGDPYQKQIERTVELVLTTGKWPNRSSLCYQSKVGPMQWLRPMMRETLEKLGHEKVEAVLMIPISFVSDHLETLYEIDIEHREIAHQCGISQYRMAPGLNDAPPFIAALAGLVRKAVSPQLAAGAGR